MADRFQRHLLSRVWMTLSPGVFTELSYPKILHRVSRKNLAGALSGALRRQQGLLIVVVDFRKLPQRLYLLGEYPQSLNTEVAFDGEIPRDLII